MYILHCVCDNRMLQESPTPGIYGNDLMTPPEVLLKGVQKEAEKLTKEKEVITRSTKSFIKKHSVMLFSHLWVAIATTVLLDCLATLHCQLLLP